MNFHSTSPPSSLALHYHDYDVVPTVQLFHFTIFVVEIYEPKNCVLGHFQRILHVSLDFTGSLIIILKIKDIIGLRGRRRTKGYLELQ